MADDILVDIPDGDLPKLAEMYQSLEDIDPLAYNFIVTGMRWKKKKPDIKITFMSPNSSWKEDGTFFILSQLYQSISLIHTSHLCRKVTKWEVQSYSFIHICNKILLHSNDLFMYTLDKSCKNICKGLTETKRLQASEGLVFYALHSDFLPIVQKLIEEKQLPTLFHMPTDTYCIPKYIAANYEIECPSDVYIGKLETSHANLVNSVWPRRYEDSEKFVAVLIENGGGYGMFLKSNNELDSWILVAAGGELALLQTVDEHKKKGYGRFIKKFLSKEIAKDGLYPVATILTNNSVSLEMFRQLEFSSLYVSHFIGVVLK